MTNPTVYVSITDLRLKGPWHAPRFMWHAMRSFRQAARAAGNLRAETRTIDGVHHTLMVWESRDAMLAFLRAGAHARAMKAFRSMATGKTFGYETEAVPTWDEVQGLWRDRGQEVG